MHVSRVRRAVLLSHAQEFSYRISTMFQLASKFVLALTLAQAYTSTAVLANANVPTNETDAMRLQAFECRCGVSHFLSMPHTNITAPSETEGCHAYGTAPNSTT